MKEEEEEQRYGLHKFWEGRSKKKETRTMPWREAKRLMAVDSPPGITRAQHSASSTGVRTSRTGTPSSWNFWMCSRNAP